MKDIDFRLGVFCYCLLDFYSGQLLCTCCKVDDVKTKVQEFVRNGIDVSVVPILEKAVYFFQDFI